MSEKNTPRFLRIFAGSSLGVLRRKEKRTIVLKQVDQAEKEGEARVETSFVLKIDHRFIAIFFSSLFFFFFFFPPFQESDIFVTIKLVTIKLAE